MQPEEVRKKRFWDYFLFINGIAIDFNNNNLFVMR